MKRFLRLLPFLSRPLVSWLSLRGLLTSRFRRPISRYEWCARPCLERLEEHLAADGHAVPAAMAALAMPSLDLPDVAAQVATTGVGDGSALYLLSPPHVSYFRAA